VASEAVIGKNRPNIAVEIKLRLYLLSAQMAVSPYRDQYQWSTDSDRIESNFEHGCLQGNRISGMCLVV
jgi:hypothetical protein